MAVNGTPETLQVHRLPLSKYINALRWLPPLPAFDRFVVLAVFDSNSNSSSIEIHSLTRSNPSNLTLQSSWSSPSRISSLKVSQTLHKPLIAASTFSDVLLADPVDASIESEVSVREKTLHVGPISCFDVQENGSECVSVGEDGRVNLVSVGNSNLSHRRFFDSNVSYTAAKWASPMEFATGGLGFSLQWWDQRKPGGPASQFKGGSSGTVFAWDLRWQQQPIVLSGVAAGEFQSHSLSESEIWEVQYDSYSSNIGNMSKSRVLPVMICSEDGILAVVEQGEEPIKLLAQPCAINSFDIDQQNPSDVICSLEWEAIANLMRA
ncbi:nuclear pore complex protein NUP43-like isoform X2 [Camellia sinensis]|uniref:nuclear pore complex protein NUP43-like isoform X2 n=1 Tax=Camellia sinensis TaxID=4442 RepID=UPI0010364826|nr:nuclear pore complex protein NUP43-like isoform X2 [Camellia sinensis]